MDVTSEPARLKLEVDTQLRRKAQGVCNNVTKISVSFHCLLCSFRQNHTEGPFHHPLPGQGLIFRIHSNESRLARTCVVQPQPYLFFAFFSVFHDTPFNQKLIVYSEIIKVYRFNSVIYLCVLLVLFYFQVETVWVQVQSEGTQKTTLNHMLVIYQYIKTL